MRVNVSAKWTMVRWSAMEDFDPFCLLSEVEIAAGLQASFGEADPGRDWRTKVRLVVCNTEFPLAADDLEIDGVILVGLSAGARSMNLEAQWTMRVVQAVDLSDEEIKESMCEAISDCLCVVVEMPHAEVEARGIARALLLEAPGDEETLEVAFEDWMGLAVRVAEAG